MLFVRLLLMGLSHLLLSVVDALAFLPCDCYSQPARTCRITASCDGMLLLKAVAFFFLRQSSNYNAKPPTLGDNIWRLPWISMRLSNTSPGVFTKAPALVAGCGGSGHTSTSLQGTKHSLAGCYELCFKAAFGFTKRSPCFAIVKRCRHDNGWFVLRCVR